MRLGAEASSRHQKEQHRSVTSRRGRGLLELQAGQSDVAQ